MEFNSIYKNGKPDYFFITIDSKKVNALSSNPTLSSLTLITRVVVVSKK